MNFEESVNAYLLGKNERRLEIMREWEREVPFLYRYRCINNEKRKDEEIETLRDGDLYCSSFERINDDEEAILGIELINNCPNEIRQRTKHRLKEMRKKYGTVCFSTVGPYDEHATHMWENYAGEGEGICIQYKFSDFIDSGFLLIPVSYVDRVSFGDFYVNGEFIIDKTYATKHHRGMDKHKHKMQEWKKEKEWRHIEKLNREDGNRCGVCIRPEKVYFGSKFIEDYQQQIIEFCSNVEKC